MRTTGRLPTPTEYSTSTEVHLVLEDLFLFVPPRTRGIDLQTRHLFGEFSAFEANLCGVFVYSIR